MTLGNAQLVKLSWYYDAYISVNGWIVLFHIQAGPYWSNLLDQSAVGIGVLLFASLETVSVCWIYGFRRFKNDIRSMIGNALVDHPTFWWWILQWSIVTPMILMVRHKYTYHVSKIWKYILYEKSRKVRLVSTKLGNIPR